MISIIVCSICEKTFQLFASNVKATVGVPFEILRIDNSSNRFTICEAYNRGALMSKYPVLCFVHEDVQFSSKDWGYTILNHLSKDPTIGVLGLAGSVFKSKMLSSWWQPRIGEFEPKRINIIQSFKYVTKEKVYLNEKVGNEIRSQVVSLDGVFLVTKKEIWQNNKFDEKLLKGFHGYDLDFTLRVGRNYKNYVVYDIMLEHFSEGKVDSSWLRDNLLVHIKNMRTLPVSIDGLLITDAQFTSVDRGFVQEYLPLVTTSSGRRWEAFKLFFMCMWHCNLVRPNRFFCSILKKIFLNRSIYKTFK